MQKYCKSADKDSVASKTIYDEYKVLRNELTRLKKDSKIDYYHKYFEEKQK